MKRLLGATALVLLVACGQPQRAPLGDKPSEPAAATPTTPTAGSGALDLSCAAFANATGASLEQRFGAANVTQQAIPGAEGSEAQGTVLFANDPVRRVEVIWNDNAGRTRPASITFTGTEGQRSQWTGPGGLSLGESLADVERANGGPFMLYGFEWDYGGIVTSWRGGAFAPQGNCTVHVAFRPGGDAGAAAGDAAFRSDSAAMQGAHAYVAEVGISFVGDSASPSSGDGGKKN